jgi:hypothetical protein
MMDLPNQPIVNTEIENQQADVAVVNARETVAESFVVPTKSSMPICTVDFKNSEIEALNAAVQVGPGTYYNSYYGSCWLMHIPARSFIKVDTTIEHLDSAKKYMLDLFHLSSIVDRKLMDARISIYMNGKAVVSGHNPNDPNYIHQQFDVTEFVVEGSNSIELRFDDGAQTNYWIQSLALLQS